jgi:hypothetical protein
MTQEEKQLLFQDLCGRLPYMVIVYINDYWNKDYPRHNEVLTTHSLSQYEKDFERWNIKPYLRPLSSMTEEEKKTLWEELDKDMEILDENIDAQIINVYKGRCYRGNPVYHEIDFLNKKHFDWRGLIPMGLAIEAPKDMYNTKTE